MDLKWRFSSGILFSFTFHALLISLLFQAYPDIKNRSVWFWKELPLIPNEKKPASVLSFGNVKKHLDILSADKIIFPDLVRIRIPIKNQVRTKNKSDHTQQNTLNSILTDVKKFPERVNVELNSNKQLSEPVVSLLSLLPNTNLQEKFQRNSKFINVSERNNIASIDSNELKNYLNGLSKILSNGWEVPIHLKESQVTVAITFEINKNGRILNWKLEESGSQALHYSVNNLMKNLQFLPALPKSYPENTYIFGVRFSPTITQKKYAGEK